MKTFYEGEIVRATKNGWGFEKDKEYSITLGKSGTAYFHDDDGDLRPVIERMERIPPSDWRVGDTVRCVETPRCGHFATAKEYVLVKTQSYISWAVRDELGASWENLPGWADGKFVLVKRGGASDCETTEEGEEKMHKVTLKHTEGLIVGPSKVELSLTDEQAVKFINEAEKLREKLKGKLEWAFKTSPNRFYQERTSPVIYSLARRRPVFPEMTIGDGWNVSVEGDKIKIGCQTFDREELVTGLKALTRDNGKDRYLHPGHIDALRCGVKYSEITGSHLLPWEDADRLLEALETYEKELRDE